jgi:hypothetical protein
MDDRPVEWHRGEYAVSTHRERLDPERILALLREEHWGGSLSRPVLERAVTHSVCFGLYHGTDLVGFGRVVTDLAT